MALVVIAITVALLLFTLQSLALLLHWKILNFLHWKYFLLFKFRDLSLAIFLFQIAPEALFLLMNLIVSHFKSRDVNEDQIWDDGQSFVASHASFDASAFSNVVQSYQ